MSSGWRLVSYDPVEAKKVLEKEEDGIVHRVTVTYEPEAYYGTNEVLRNASEGRRWGDFQLVSSMPLHVYFDSPLFEAQQADDEPYVKKWLNDFDNRGYRTFQGRV